MPCFQVNTTPKLIMFPSFVSKLIGSLWKEIELNMGKNCQNEKLPFWIKWKRILFRRIFLVFDEKFGLEHSRDWNLHFEKKRIRFRELLQTPKNTKIRHHKNSQNISYLSLSNHCQNGYSWLGNIIWKKWLRNMIIHLEKSIIT